MTLDYLKCLRQLTGNSEKQVLFVHNLYWSLPKSLFQLRNQNRNRPQFFSSISRSSPKDLTSREKGNQIKSMVLKMQLLYCYESQPYNSNRQLSSHQGLTTTSHATQS